MMDLSWINTLIPYMIPLFVAVYAIKWLSNYMSNKERKKVVDKPRNSQDRIYIGFKNVAKMSNLLSHKPVYVKGDGLRPPHKIGETATGIIPMTDQYVTFIRPKWWFFWVKPTCLFIEPELTSDLNGGELHVLGTGLKPLGENYSYIIPPSSYFKDVSVEEVERRRSRVAQKLAVELLNFDLNSDIDLVIKEALRGDQNLAMRDVILSGEMPRMTKEQRNREYQREREELESNRGRGGHMNMYGNMQQPPGGGGL